MDSLLLACNQKLKTLSCCHDDGRKCYCYDCLKEGFFHKQDAYDCIKKMNYYILNYGPSYASEIYQYLSASQVLESMVPLNRKIKILSLGCGFAPDLLAIEKYIVNRQLPLQFEYHGIDQSKSWEDIHYPSSNATFTTADVSSSIDFSGYDLVFIVKLFSTLCKHNNGEKFLKLITQSVKMELKKDGLVIYNDVNSKYMGRDYFHSSVNTLFGNARQFFFSKDQYWEPQWVQLPRNVVVSIPTGLMVSPLPLIANTIVFEYRK